MSLLSRKRVMLIKEEASGYGVDPTPTPAANSIDAKNIKINESADLLERDVVRGHLSPVTPKVGKRWYDISFEVELKGSGTAGTAGKIGDLLEACGFVETASAGSSVVYRPASSSFKSAALYVYDLPDTGANALLRKLLGFRGNIRIIAEAGNIPRIEVSGKALFAIPTDQTIPTGMVYETTLPPIVESAAFTLAPSAAGALIVQSVTIDMGTELTDEDDISSATALKGFKITGRKPVGSFNPEAVLVATQDFWTDWVGAMERALSMVIGTAAGNKCTISAPKVTLENLGEGDRGGILTKDIPFRMNANAGNDEIELKFE